ncbi:MAG: histidine kinase [Clostridiales bacterium]|nr:histidine kinase [Clostridiales bacterium]
MLALKAKLSIFFSFVRSLGNHVTVKIIVMFLFTVLPLNALVIAATVQSIVATIEIARQSHQSMVNFYMQDLDNKMSAVNYYLYDLADSDSSFIRLMGQKRGDPYTLAKSQIVRKFRTSIATAGNADGYFIYSKKLDDSLFVLLQRTENGIWDIPSREYRDEVSSYILGQGINHKKRWSLVEIEGKQWLVYVNALDEFYYGAVISVETTKTALTRSVTYGAVNAVASPGVVGKDRISASASSKLVDMSLSLETPVLDVIKTLPLLQWIGVGLAFLYIFLSPMMLHILNLIVLQPLSKIREALMRLKAGESGYRIESHPRAYPKIISEAPEKSGCLLAKSPSKLVKAFARIFPAPFRNFGICTKYSDEFIVINKAFNEMADSINRLKIENYEKEMERQRITIRNLQLQIRPHFLLNMFKLAHGLAQIGETSKIQSLALYLSDYFRYIFRNNQEMDSLENEIALIRKYLNIAAIRYPGRFTAEFDVDERALPALIPPLLIHNFVENVFAHAMTGKGLINIKIRAFVDSAVIILVEDNGAGMKPETVSQINDGSFDKSDLTGHIGIMNSCLRIRYFYNGKGSVKVWSELGKGSSVRIEIPEEGSL